MSKHVRKSHNVSVLLYHLVCPTKYRRIVSNQKVDETLKKVCLDISVRYEIAFIEIGVDKDHTHFLIQSVPSYSPSEIAQLVKSITGREIFKRVPRLKSNCGVKRFGQVASSGTTRFVLSR
jgi:REP element-mobilizing transposase RayT